MLNRCLRVFLLALFALAANVSAHHVEGAPSAPQIPSHSSVATPLQGYVDELFVENRVAGTTTRFAVFVGNDGQRMLLKGVGTETLAAGAAVTLTAKIDGRTVFAQAAPQLLGADVRQAQAKAAASTTLSGMLRLGHADNFDGQPSEFFFTLFAHDGSRVDIKLAALLGVLQNRMEVTVTGRLAADGELIADSIVIDALPLAEEKAAAVAKATVTNQVLVIPIKFKDINGVFPADPFTVASITTAVFGVAPTQSVAEYYKEVSFNQQLLAGTVANVNGNWLQAGTAYPTPVGCDYTFIGSQADAAATAAGYNINNYPNRVYVFASTGFSCGWAGLAYVGFGRAWIKQTTNLLVIVHELGHNFGLLHAASLDCGTQPIGGACSASEYGEPFGVMGNQRAMHFNAMQKRLLNWIPASSAPTHPLGTTTYTLTPIETAGGAQYAVRIPTPLANRTYWVEYRQPVGFDSALASFPNNGAQIRVASPFETVNGSDDTQFLDMTPATGAFTDGTLLAGQSFTDPNYGITINVLSATPGANGALSVQVVSTTGQAATSTTLASSLNPSTVGASVTFTASVTGVLPTGNVAFRDGANNITGCSAVALTGAGNTKTAACTTSTLTQATHSITAVYAGDAANLTSTSSALSQVVNAAGGASTNVARASNGGVASASSFISGFSPAGAINGELTGTSWGAEAGWNDSTPNVLPDWLQVNFNGQKTINKVVVYSLQDNFGNPSAPTDTMTFGLYGLAAFEVQTWNGNAWVNVASVTGNNLVKRTVNFAATTTDRIRVNVTNALGGYSRVVEVEAWTVGGAGPGPTTTTLVSSLNPSTVGGNVTFTASVTGVLPTGNVAFRDGANNITGCSAVALTGAGNTKTAACTTSTLTQGTHSITAVYAGDAGNATSTSSALSQAVKANTTAALASSLNPSTVGASVTFTASVTGVLPTGNVAFRDGANNITGCSAVALTGAGNTKTAACTTSTLTQATHSITAVYAGDTGNNTSTSSALSQVVNAAAPVATTTTLASSLNPSTVGASVTFTASVTGVLPTGNVAFRDGANNITGCSAVALTGAGNTKTAACTTSTLTQATHSITAVYAGDAANLTSTSSALSQVVNAAGGASTNVARASNGGVASASSFISGFSPAGAINGELTGTSWGAEAGWNDSTPNVLPDWLQVNFNGQKTINKVVVYSLQDNFGNPSAPTDTMTFGLYGLAAFEVQTWNGNAWVNVASVTGNNLVKRTVNFAATTTDRIRVNVTNALGGYSRVVEVEAWTVGGAGPGPTTTTLVSSLNPSTVGGNVTFTASVTGVLPTGSVAFRDGANNITGCSAVALTGAGNTKTAACTTSALAQGTHSITAVYAGDAGNATSTSSSLSQVVNGAGPGTSNTTLATSINPSTVGINVTLTATVTGTLPTGNVAFRDGGNNISGCSAVALTGAGNSKTAACTTNALPQGTRSVTAVYAGDAGNTTSTSPVMSQIVNAAGGGGPGSCAPLGVMDFGSIDFDTTSTEAFDLGKGDKEVAVFSYTAQASDIGKVTHIGVVEYGSGIHYYTVWASRTRCEMTGATQEASTQSPNVWISVNGNQQVNMAPGETWYFMVRNWRASTSRNSCSDTTCGTLVTKYIWQ